MQWVITFGSPTDNFNFKKFYVLPGEMAWKFSTFANGVQYSPFYSCWLFQFNRQQANYIRGKKNFKKYWFHVLLIKFSENSVSISLPYGVENSIETTEKTHIYDTFCSDSFHCRHIGNNTIHKCSICHLNLNE